MSSFAKFTKKFLKTQRRKSFFFFSFFFFYFFFIFFHFFFFFDFFSIFFNFFFIFDYNKGSYWRIINCLPKRYFPSSYQFPWSCSQNGIWRRGTSQKLHECRFQWANFKEVTLFFKTCFLPLIGSIKEKASLVSSNRF